MQSYLNFETSATTGISIFHVKEVFNKFLFLVKVRAFHFKQLLACLSKLLISIAVYDRITQRIERDNRNDNGMGQNYYVCNVTITCQKHVQK